MSAYPSNGDGTYAVMRPCPECGSMRVFVDDSPFCADCEDDA